MKKRGPGRRSPLRRKASTAVPTKAQDNVKPVVSVAKPATTRNSSTKVSVPRVAGIGASAGGLEAFTQLLQALPTNTGMAFVMVQHLEPTHESILPTLLARATKMPVAEAGDGMCLEPNHVYVIPANTYLSLTDGEFRVVPRISGGHPAGGRLFRIIGRITAIPCNWRRSVRNRLRRYCGVKSHQAPGRRHFCAGAILGEFRWNASQCDYRRMRRFCAAAGAHCGRNRPARLQADTTGGAG